MSDEPKRRPPAPRQGGKLVFVRRQTPPDRQAVIIGNGHAPSKNSQPKGNPLTGSMLLTQGSDPDIRIERTPSMESTKPILPTEPPPPPPSQANRVVMLVAAAGVCLMVAILAAWAVGWIP